MKTLTDQGLKQLLARMLPDKLLFHGEVGHERLCYKCDDTCYKVLYTELLSLCRMVELKLTNHEWNIYRIELSCQCPSQGYRMHEEISASWEQRTEALAKVKGLI